MLITSLFQVLISHQHEITIETPSSPSTPNIPLTNFNISVDITGTAAQANYTLTYKNKGKNTLVEAKLKFPFDTDIAVSDVILRYQNKTVTGILMNSSKAAETYDNYKKDKNIAMLVHRSSDFISIDLAGIGPGEEFTAELTTHQSLNVKFDHQSEYHFLRYVFPTSMVPRYTSFSHDIPTELNGMTFSTTDSPSLSSTVPYAFYIQLHSHCGPINSSILKQLLCKFSDNNHTLIYSGPIPSQDIVIDIICSSSNETSITIETFGNSTVTEYLIPSQVIHDLISQSKLSSSDHRPSYVFLIDRSGSMWGKSIQNSAKALKLFLHSLPENSLFEIVSFGTRYNTLFGQLADYNDSSLEKAISYADRLSADMGGTEMLQPLKYILPQHPDHLIFLTDGAVSNTDEIKAYCSRFSTQICTIAIGNAAAVDLLRSISRRSGGSYELVENSEHIQGAVIRSLSSTTTGFVVSSITSEAGDLWQSFPFVMSEAEVFPIRFFSSNKKDSLPFPKLKLSGAMVGKTENVPLIINESVAKVIKSTGKNLHSVALMRAIADHVLNDDEIFEQSMRLNLMSKLTSFVLVDERTRNLDLQNIQVDIPVLIRGESFIHASPKMMVRSSLPFPTNSKSKTAFSGVSFSPKKMDSNEEFHDSSDDVCSIVANLQGSRGNWNNLQKILDTLGLKLNSEIIDHWKDKNDLLTSVIVLMYLEGKCGSNYQFIIKKGYEYVQKNFEKGDINKLKKELTLMKIM